MAETTKALPNRLVERISVSDLQTIYTNSVEITYSLFDFIFTMGQMEVATQELLRTKQLVKIAFSPQHAKILAKVLNQKLAEYEERFGPIPGVEAGASAFELLSEQSPGAAPESTSPP